MRVHRSANQSDDAVMGMRKRYKHECDAPDSLIVFLSMLRWSGVNLNSRPSTEVIVADLFRNQNCNQSVYSTTPIHRKGKNVPLRKLAFDFQQSRLV